MKLAIIIEDLNDLQLDRTIPDDVIFELRIDRDPRLLDQVPEISQSRKIVLTLRSRDEGGEFDNNSQDRADMLRKMSNLSPDYIDFEIKRDSEIYDTLDTLNTENTVPIHSMHNYSMKMRKVAKEFLDNNTSLLDREDIVVKLVGKPEDSYDMMKSLSLLCDVFPRHIILGVGRHGILSRTMAADFNQEFVFGATSPGIIPEYHKLLEAHQNGSLLTGLLGKSLSHSLSPKIHQLLRKRVNIPGYYHLFEIQNEENVPLFLEMLAETSIQGINVTYPYKSIVVEQTQPDRNVSRSGVSNTLVFDDGKIKAYNTDISGFGRFLDSIEVTSLETAVILGAGGASRSVAFALIDRGIELIICNRSPDRLENLPDEIKEHADLNPLDTKKQLEPDIYINATTVGYDNKSPQSLLEIPKSTRLVIDLNYAPSQTILVHEAKQLGIEAYDGKGMLFHQAVDAFELWTDETIDRDVVLSEFTELVQ